MFLRKPYLELHLRRFDGLKPLSGINRLMGATVYFRKLSSHLMPALSLRVVKSFLSDASFSKCWKNDDGENKQDKQAQ